MRLIRQQKSYRIGDILHLGDPAQRHTGAEIVEITLQHRLAESHAFHHATDHRGFGGAEFPDIFYYYERVITRYAPKKIVLYVGDNDVARGKSADTVFADYLKLVAMIRQDLPEAELPCMSVKPSKARWDYWPVMVEVNRRVAEHAATDPQLGYLDLASPLLVEGVPGPFYIFDGLHLNAAGYEHWREVMAPRRSSSIS